MKQDVLRQAALQVVQSIIAALAAAVAGQESSAEGLQSTSKLVLPVLTILLEWWSVHPACSM